MESFKVIHFHLGLVAESLWECWIYDLMAGTRNGLEGSLGEGTAIGFDVGFSWSTMLSKKKIMVMGTHQGHDHDEPCHEALLGNIAGFSGEGGGDGGGGPMFWNTSNQLAFLSDIYDAPAVGSGARGAVVPRTPNHYNDTFSFSSSGKVLFFLSMTVQTLTHNF